MYRNKKVSVVIPTYNEADSIRATIEAFYATGVVDEVVAVDNNALRHTSSEIQKTKAIHIKEERQGYGYALMRGLNEATGDLIIMCEADGTAEPKDVLKFLLYSDSFPVVLSTRTSRAAIFSGAFMPFPVRVGNWLWAKIVEVLFNGPSMSDIGSTYKLIDRETLEKIKKYFALSDGDGKFSPEFIMWVIHAGVMPIEIPVLFKPRIGESMYTGSVWRAAKLGFRELWMIIKYRLGIISMKKLSKKNIVSNYELVAMTLVFISSLFVRLFSALRFSNDDQFILYRYIQNIADGNGFVYNLGERVLGATTPLFTLTGALLKYLFYSQNVPDIVAVLNIILITLASLFFFKLVQHFVSLRFTLLSTLIFGFNLARVIPEGMETSLFILLVLSFLHYIFNARKNISALLLGLLLLTRPDGVIIAAFGLMYVFINFGRQAAIKFVVITSCVVLPWLLFSTFYFGSFIPQSVIAKTHTNDIVNQVSYQAFKVQFSSISRIYWGKLYDPDNIKSQIAFNLLPMLALIVFSLRKIDYKKYWLLYVIPLSYLLTYGLSNPVMFPWYLSQMEPFWIILSYVGVVYLYSIIKYRTLALTMLVLFIITPPAFGWYQLVSRNDPGSKTPLFEVGEYLKDNVKDRETVGVNNIGIIGYISDAYIIDFFGLVNNDSPYFYPVNECVDKSIQYIIPPNLIQHFSPDWLVVSGETELTECFKKGKWFKNNYQLDQSISSARIYRKSNEF